MLTESEDKFRDFSDKDREMKQRGKDVADQKRGAKESNIRAGDKVLLRQRKIDKLTPPFNEVPFEVVDKFHDQVTLRSPEGVNYKRNLAHVKKYDTSEGLSVEPSLPENSAESQDTPDIVQTPRPVRSHKVPSRFKDFVTELK